MDYRTLLIRYMAHVIAYEGIDFLSVPMQSCLTDEELIELNAISSAAVALLGQWPKVD